MGDRASWNTGKDRDIYGPLDEVVVENCDIHLEQMSESGFIIVVTRGDELMRISIHAKGRGHVVADIDVDDGFHKFRYVT